MSLLDLETWKTWYDAVKGGLDAEQLRQLIDLRSEILDLQQQLLVLRQENDRLRQSVSDREALTYDEVVGVFFNDAKEAYCAKCFQGEDQAAVRMKRDNYFYRCPVCKSTAKHTEFRLR